MSELPDGVFGNFTRLQDLSLVSNQLTELPDGIFQGLTTLRHLYIGENTVSPFTIAAELERRDANTIALRVAQATPFDMIVTLSAEGGALSSTTVPIAAGSVSSGPVTVSPDGYGLVTVSVVSAAFELREFNTAIGIQTGLGNPITLGANTPATGAPMVSGTAQVGKTLTAATSGIADEDGLDNVTFTYQWLADDTAIQGATGSTYTLVDADEGKAIKVRVSFTDDAGNEETLSSEATDPVTVPLTASLENTPDTHDGQNVFTFELRFSEEPELSYRTLRDQAFTVAGGTVEKAKRITPGSNIRWRITVRPDGDGPVTITLPATTDCDAEGAICTGDGRMLSNRLVLTIRGPSE